MRNAISLLFNYSKSVILISVFISLSITAFAQKAAKVQKNSLYAPANLKIDGKTSEWNDQFQAYNKATKLFYNMANNDTLLYIGLKATDATTVIKILTNGITFTVNNTLNNKHISITFPLIKKNDLANIKNGIRKKTAVASTDFVTLIRMTDSTTRAWNRQLALKLKEIKIDGIEELSDTLSVYNDSGIKTTLLLDSKKTCTYELAVPLKYFGLSIANLSSFNYTIQVNGTPLVKGLNVQMSPDGRAIERTFEGTTVSMPSSDEQIALEFPVSLKGRYILARK